jgi:hypothetical protein
MYIGVKDHLGNEYRSKLARAKAYGLNVATIENRLNVKHLSLEEALTTKRLPRRGSSGDVSDHLGNTYISKSEMARAWNITVSMLYGRLKAGMSLEKALTYPNMVKVAAKDHLGKEYKSLSEMARAWGKSPSVLYHRLNNLCMSVEEALTTPMYGTKGHSAVCEDHNGKKFNSIIEMCTYHNVQYSTYHDRLRAGCSLEEALTGRDSIYSVCDHLGNRYPSTTAMCKHYGVNKSTFRSRIISKNYTLEEALCN